MKIHSQKLKSYRHAYLGASLTQEAQLRDGAWVWHANESSFKFLPYLSRALFSLKVTYKNVKPIIKQETHI